jgi:putative spermidine/putrescine transport system ATP-binding protein/spermidine/putrescine transport system ATP-binding protein
VADDDLELVGVGKTYDNGTPAVIDFSLAVGKGEFIAFLGPSGCGKTTTLRMIAGFETITKGDIYIRRRRINDLPPERRPTSMIFQNYALFPHMTVRGNLGFGLDVKRMARAERDAKVDRILDKLGLTDIADKRTDRLSGGQRQRIALARGLVVEPDILLLDEPLGALDANLRKAIQAELRLLQRNLGITFVFVTHAQSEALTMSDRIVVMNQGRIEQISAPYELYTRPRTPFVAQFIGRNTILDGVVRSGDGIVVTQFGVFGGQPGGALAVGASAKLVIPSEAFDIHPVDAATTQALDASYSGNLLPGVVERRDVVGHLVQMTVQLDSSRSVLLEGHVDKYRIDSLRPLQNVWIAWRPQEATVIVA